ncbi:MAG: hypothetical protein ACRC92_20320 [Peptostreptococcaceae bacterium]
MLKITNVRIYGEEESVVASGYPMRIDADSVDMDDEIILNESDLKRANKLGSVASGTGHDNFLKGIIVQFDVTYPNYWTPQFQRYHFADIVSSTSKMHRITKMNLKESCNEYVDDVVIENLNTWVDIFNGFSATDKYAHLAKDTNKIICYSEDLSTDEKFIELTKPFSKYEVYMKIISNCPMGLEQTMRVTTSLLQLKTIHAQRRHHKLKEDWGNFCDWVEGLDIFQKYVMKK